MADVADMAAWNEMMLARRTVSEPSQASCLIPSLPDDVFLRCLIRVPVQAHATLQGVSQGVKALIRSGEYYSMRKDEGTSASYVCFLQPMPMSTEMLAEKCCSFMSASFDPVYGVTLLDAKSGEWERLPAIPGLPRGLPTFCKLIVVERKLVAMGGWWQSTWEPSRSVFVYDFASQRWSQGADMPSVRNFFAVGGLGSKVIVAGGHDAEKKALSTVEAFDVETRCWETMPSLLEDRDECTGVVMDNRLFVVSGYGRESQGVFRKSGEVWDPVLREWKPIANMWPFLSRDTDVANPGSLAATAGQLYAIHGKDVVVYSADKNAWNIVDKIPEDPEKGEFSPSSIASTGNTLVITGLVKMNDTATLRTLRLSPGHGGASKPQWSVVECNDEFLNLTQAACSLEM